MTEAELIARYAPEVQRMARGLGWYLQGAELEDLEQEALIGLLLAARTHRPELGPFPAFARLCARRRMTTALRLAKAHKHGSLTFASRVMVNEEGETMPAVEAIPAVFGDPERELAAREALRAVLRAAEGLTDIERCAVFGVACGGAYSEFGPFKRVDNASQRGLKKLRRAA